MLWRQSLPGALASRGALRGFSLVEILVACAVLTVLVGILASALSGFVSVASTSGGRLESNNQSRTAFDRLAFDLGSSIRNDDVTIDFHKNAQVLVGTASLNDSLALLADVRSTAGDSRAARIGYEVGEASDAASGVTGAALMRCVEPFPWTDDVLNKTLTSAAERQPLGGGIFRMEFSFLKKDGTLVANPPAQEDIAALIVATATLDEATLSKLQPAERTALAQALADSEDGKLPLAGWNVTDFDDLPRPVAQAVRFHQRYFYLR